jgi:hypothetical protein
MVMTIPQALIFALCISFQVWALMESTTALGRHDAR